MRLKFGLHWSFQYPRIGLFCYVKVSVSWDLPKVITKEQERRPRQSLCEDRVGEKKKWQLTEFSFLGKLVTCV